ncbi:RNA ligase partner protein [Patescibacteria group bacterium]|nr:RNA ligase partner protein [Patescibacteria group bacterium]
MDSYVLDTNLFFNMEAGLGLGKKAEEVLVNLTAIIKRLSGQPTRFYMPPRVVDELVGFFAGKDQTAVKQFLAVVNIKSPDNHNLQVGAAVFARLIDDVRSRHYRGMLVAEEAVVQAGKTMVGKDKLDKKQFEMTLGPVVKKFRQRYRQATRFGFIDSLADLDLILLAKELDAFLVSSDEGVLRWGRWFGIRETPVSVFASRLNSY